MRPEQTYIELQSDFQTGRELEAELLLRAARKLQHCARKWHEQDSRAFAQELEDAVQFNQKLWTLLQVEMSDPENPLPREIRGNILRLARFVDRTTMALCAGGNRKDLETLARINQALAEGLLAREHGKTSSKEPDPILDHALDMTS